MVWVPSLAEPGAGRLLSFIAASDTKGRVIFCSGRLGFRSGFDCGRRGRRAGGGPWGAAGAAEDGAGGWLGPFIASVIGVVAKVELRSGWYG